jgi:hypothetical protein
MKLVRTLRDWEPRPAGSESLAWDGQTEGGKPVAPGTYLARVQAKYPRNTSSAQWQNIFYATSWVTVAA